MLSIYAAMLREGIPVREADETDLDMYLKVIAFAAKHDKDRDERGIENTVRGRKQVVELRRGFIDEFWG